METPVPAVMEVSVPVPGTGREGPLGDGAPGTIREGPTGVFICRGREDALVTRNLVPGESVYGEKRISVEDGDTSVEYRAWNPFRSKLAAAILGGIDQIHIRPGAKVLYLGAASGTTVSHVSDIVGQASPGSGDTGLVSPKSWGHLGVTPLGDPGWDTGDLGVDIDDPCCPRGGPGDPH
ncbi:hypothetical protein HGM15179_020902 [Zosterops borbonicus]|uniref:rRNA 2'-O-methyltransferase fibrillarin n=1 Tax=Zosterops borbonicus TaxID=364589 RepID=A0A8K1FXD6_9PASS|nr:hypothetical protein HGM15179_020902 [Zosterops borbonicus]